MLQPLLMMLVLYVVFSHVFRFEVYRYPVYALSGILFWNFFQQSIVASMNSLRGNAAILQKLPVPKAVFPVATVISGVVNLCLALVPLLGILVVTGQPADARAVVPARLDPPGRAVHAGGGPPALAAGRLLQRRGRAGGRGADAAHVPDADLLPDEHRARALPLDGALQPDPLRSSRCSATPSTTARSRPCPTWRSRWSSRSWPWPSGRWPSAGAATASPSTSDDAHLDHAPARHRPAGASRSATGWPSSGSPPSRSTRCTGCAAP